MSKTWTYFHLFSSIFEGHYYPLLFKAWPKPSNSDQAKRASVFTRVFSRPISSAKMSAFSAFSFTTTAWERLSDAEAVVGRSSESESLAGFLGLQLVGRAKNPGKKTRIGSKSRVLKNLCKKSVKFKCFHQVWDLCSINVRTVTLGRVKLMTATLKHHPFKGVLWFGFFGPDYLTVDIICESRSSQRNYKAKPQKVELLPHLRELFEVVPWVRTLSR